MEKKKLVEELHEKSGIPIEILEKNDQIFELIKECYSGSLPPEERNKVMEQINKHMKRNK